MVKGSRSKFFITLGPANHLNSTTTVFGKVAGSTIFNVLRLGAVPTDEDDAPEYPVKLLSAEVILNPFNDIVEKDLEKIAHPRTNLSRRCHRRIWHTQKTKGSAQQRAPVFLHVWRP